MFTPKEVFQPDKLYLYLCADGITRQRCGRHVHHEAWCYPVRIWLVQRPSKRHTCIECLYQSLDKDFVTTGDEQ